MVDVKTIDLEKDGSIGCIVDYNGINLDMTEMFYRRLCVMDLKLSKLSEIYTKIQNDWREQNE